MKGSLSLGLSFGLLACACATPEQAPGGTASGSLRGAPDPRAASVRFVAIGDAGSGGADADHVVAAAVASCGTLGGCDFGVLLGDNIYPRGIGSASDPQWQAKLERPLAPLQLPFYAVLGNHDYGAPDALAFLGPIGVDPRRARAALDRAAGPGPVRMPGQVFRVDAGPAELVFFDTQPLYWRDAPVIASALGLEDDAAQIERDVAMFELQSTARFRIALGHHPVRSNGVHGDAGSYEVFGEGMPFSGSALRRFFDARVLGRFDLYLSGHDHNLQDMGDERGTALVVSGAGSEHRPLEDARPVPFAVASLGFVVIEVNNDAIELVFVTVDDSGSATPGAWRIAHRRTVKHAQHALRQP